MGREIEQSFVKEFTYQREDGSRRKAAVKIKDLEGELTLSWRLRLIRSLKHVTRSFKDKVAR